MVKDIGANEIYEPALTEVDGVNRRSNKYYRLSDEEKRLVDELRERVKDNLHPNYDTDYNLYRWLRSADRTSRQRGNIDLAEKLLWFHLRYRKALKLDEIEIPNWDDNPMFAKRYLPRGFLHYMTSRNMFLWWVDYSSLDMPGMMNTISSTELIVWHFWKYEYMLRVVNECERRTGAMSGVHMVMDLKGYAMNPVTMMQATNGQMAQFTQFFQYANYPELTFPFNLINLPKWLMFPIRLIRAVLPKDFNERIRVCDCNFQDDLLQQISAEDLPRALGGTNERSEELETIKADKLDPNQFYTRQQRADELRADHVSHIQVGARKRKFILIDCPAGTKLRWWFVTDYDVDFGIYYLPQHINMKEVVGKDCNKEILDKLVMVHPFLGLSTKYVPERWEVVCQTGGTYVIVFCNRGSWMYKRNIQMKFYIDENPYDTKKVLERMYSVS